MGASSIDSHVLRSKKVSGKVIFWSVDRCHGAHGISCRYRSWNHKNKGQPDADGSYTLTGTKIFITGGEHDMAENIIHLVLAKLPDAPGTKGISLFIVPKFMVQMRT